MCNTVKIKDIKLENKKLYLSITAEIAELKSISAPKLKFYFKTEGEDRILPVIIDSSIYENNMWVMSGSFEYELNNVFWNPDSKKQNFSGQIFLFCGNGSCEAIRLEADDTNLDNEFYRIAIYDNKIYVDVNREKLSNNENTSKIIKRRLAIIYYWMWSLVEFIPRKFNKVPLSNKRNSKLRKFSEYSKKMMIKKLYKEYTKQPIVENQILFSSQRSNEFEGNLKMVHDEISKSDKFKICTLLDKTFLYDMTYKNIKEFAELCAKSKVIIVDDYVPQLYVIDVREETKVVQLWHACGAFKTFGFSRLGKPDGSKQKSRVHRNYDLSIVSSESIRQCYAEGFGISLNKVFATGVPRTDLLFDETYKNNIVEKIYLKYPTIKGKKVILFAPTFRGTIKEDAYYPMEKFDIEYLMSNLSEEYVLLIKHHPFVKNEIDIPAEYKDRVLDVKEYPEINDLLYVTDVLITDYSSVIFEGALLNKKMIFYVFDLEEYIKERDFYFDFENFIPGNMVKTQKELLNTIKNDQVTQNELDKFKSKYLEACDGNATKRVVNQIFEFF